MRLEIHYRIAKKISAEIKELGFNLHETSFIFGNCSPHALVSVQSYNVCYYP